MCPRKCKKISNYNYKYILYRKFCSLKIITNADSLSQKIDQIFIQYIINYIIASYSIRIYENKILLK